MVTNDAMVLTGLTSMMEYLQHRQTYLQIVKIEKSLHEHSLFMHSPGCCPSTTKA